MNNARWVFVVGALLCFDAYSAALAQSTMAQMVTADVLRGVDFCRMPVAEGRIQAGVMLVSAGKSTPASLFEITFSKTGARRMETLEGPRKGQRVLLTNDGYWLYMPGAKNAVRLTQLQRLLGQASFGDIGRIRFAEEYTATEVVPRQAGLMEFHLAARDGSNPYRNAVLTVDAANNCPVEAVFTFPSGKVFKTVRFSRPTQDGNHIMIREMRFVDPADASRYSSITYSRLESREFSALLFTPDALLPN